MQVIVKGRHFESTKALRDYAEEKVLRVTKYFDQINKAEVELIVEKNPSIADNQTVEVTIFTKGPVIRAKQSTADMYTSIDKAADKLERQIKKYKGKLYHSSSKNAVQAAALKKEIEEEQKPKIVKTKQFAIKPMAPAEATMQMDLLGHDFFVFTNAETEEVNVVYRRKDGNYGLIEPRANLR